jgi:hypothetical protein
VGDTSRERERHTKRDRKREKERKREREKERKRERERDVSREATHEVMDLFKLEGLNNSNRKITYPNRDLKEMKRL